MSTPTAVDGRRRDHDPVLAAYRPTEAPRGPMMRWVLPYLGAYLALAALPLLLATGVPWQAWALAMALWFANRLAHVATVRSVGGLPQAMAVGAAGFGMMLRVWVVSTALFLIGADLDLGRTHLGADRPDIAVPAMLIFLACFTFDIASRALIELHRYRAVPLPTTASAPATAEGGE